MRSNLLPAAMALIALVAPALAIMGGLFRKVGGQERKSK